MSRAKTRTLPPAKARVYLEKANRFLLGAQASLGSSAWDAAVSAAVHAAISAVDAICIEALGRRSAADQHDEALALLDRIDDLPSTERDDVARHCEALLQMKHLAEYEDRLCEEAEARRALQHAERALVRVRRWMERPAARF